jgi:hypothetical protein
MKKIIISFAMLWATAALVNAQHMFLGGSVGLELGSLNVKTSAESKDGPFMLGLMVMPKIGFYLNDKVAVGLQGGVGLQSVISAAGAYRPDGTIDKDNDYTDTNFSWEVMPFVRFSLVEVNNFAFLLEGGIGLYGASGKTKKGTTATDKQPSTFGFGLEVVPVLSYNVSERLGIEVSSDILRLAAGRQTETWKSGSNETKERVTFFGVGANTPSETLGTAFSVGAVLKF